MGLPKFKRVARCIFCGQKSDSKEHGWPEWVLNRLPSDIRIVGSVDGAKYHDPHQRQVRIKCVCFQCNEGWMKRLEDSVIPTIGLMMNDVSIPLDRVQQTRIAQWAMKTAMVWEFVSPTNPIFYTDAERMDLRLRGLIPMHTMMWIARHVGPEVLNTRANSGIGHIGQHRVEGHVTTIALGHFAIQALTMRPNGFTGALPIDGDRPRWERTAQPVWPPTANAVYWPGLSSVPNDALDLFHARFGLPISSTGAATETTT